MHLPVFGGLGAFIGIEQSPREGLLYGDTFSSWQFGGKPPDET